MDKLNQAQKIGIISGLLSGIWMLAEYWFGLHAKTIGQYSGFLGIVILMGAVYIGIFRTREVELGGILPYKQGIKSGMIVAVFSAIILAVFTYIYYAFVNPNFINFIIPQAVTYWKKTGRNESEFYADLIKLKEAYEPFKQATRSIFGTLILGLIFSALASVFMRRSVPMEV